MRYITLDTGRKGAMVLFDKGEPIDALPFKNQGQGIDTFHVARKLYDWKPEVAYVEKITARPGQGAKATFTQGFIVGQCHALAHLYCSIVEYITPQRWTSFTKRLSINPTDTSKNIAQELTKKFYFEYAAPFKSSRGHKLYHDGVADCLCINLYIERDKYIDFLT